MVSSPDPPFNYSAVPIGDNEPNSESAVSTTAKQNVTDNPRDATVLEPVSHPTQITKEPERYQTRLE